MPRRSPARAPLAATAMDPPPDVLAECDWDDIRLAPSFLASDGLA